MKRRSGNSLVQDLEKKLSGNPEKRFSDVTLECNDAVKLRGARLLLSARSTYFDRVFADDEKYGKKSAEISVPLESSVMHEVLDFLHTDTCPLLRKVQTLIDGVSAYIKLTNSSNSGRGRNGNTGQGPRPVLYRRTLKDVTLLARAAKFLQFSSLLTATQETMLDVVKSFPYTACTVFEAFWGQHKVSTDKKPPDCIMEWFNLYPNITFVGSEVNEDRMEPRFQRYVRKGYSFSTNDLRFLAKKGYGIRELSADAFLLLYSLLDRPANNEFYFHMLLAWSRSTDVAEIEDPLTELEKGPLASHTKAARKRRRKYLLEEKNRAARHSAFLMDYSKMRPLFIATVVEQSGLLDLRHLKNIYRKLLLPNYQSDVITIDQ